MVSVCFRSITAIAVVALTLTAAGQQERAVSGDTQSRSDVSLVSNPQREAAAEQQQIAGLLDEVVTALEARQSRPGDKADEAAVLKRLGKVTRILLRAAERLDEISGSYEPPPEEDQAAVLDSLNEIMALANEVSSSAADLARRTR